MNEKLSLSELQKRWKHALTETGKAVSGHPAVYADLKALLKNIIDRPVDIKEYFSTAERLVHLLRILDPNGNGSIFHLFSERIAPKRIWQVRLLRVECKDMLAYLNAFDKWRRQTHRLQVLK